MECCYESHHGKCSLNIFPKIHIHTYTLRDRDRQRRQREREKMRGKERVNEGKQERME